MGNTCSPDKKAERQVQDTDAEEVKEAAAAASAASGTDLTDKDPKKLFEILNSYIAENEKLAKENAALKDKSVVAGADAEKAGAIKTAENKKLLEELEQLKALTKEQGLEIVKSKEKIEEEEIRIAKLKLRSELRDAEARVLAESSAVAAVLIEGDLQKFTKGGKGKPTRKSVSITQRQGELTYLPTQEREDGKREMVPVGWAPGNLVLVWSDDEKSQTLSRAPIAELTDGADLVTGKGFEKRTFSLRTQTGKLIAFAAKDEAEKDRWFNTVARAMEDIQTETENMHVDFAISKEFKSRPLGFRVEEQELRTKDGADSEDVLMVTKVNLELAKELPAGLVVTSCNGVSFEKLTYQEKLDVIKQTECPFSMNFKGKEFLRSAGPSARTKAGARAGHARDVSMQVLYPELFAELTKDGSMSREAMRKHPIVQGNAEFKSWLERPDFKDLLQDLMSDPDKLRDFLTKKDL